MSVHTVGVAAVRHGDAEDAIIGSSRPKQRGPRRGTYRVHTTVCHSAAEGATRSQVLVCLRLLPRADWVQEAHL